MGRPPIEIDQPGLKDAIMDLCQNSSAAEDKRRYEGIRTTRTLDELHSELKNLDFKLCRSSTHYRLMPARSNTKEGQRHVRIAPVKVA